MKKVSLANVNWHEEFFTKEYDRRKTDGDRYELALEWGRWAIKEAGGYRDRPPMRPRSERPLRIGYVSSDFCQHVVGLLVKDVIKAHDTQRFEVYLYANNAALDWVSDELRAAGKWTQIDLQADRDVAELISNDRIDILVDLSGHTKGSRSSVFAFRPAPVLISWLGYFATSGLEYFDAIFLDKYYITENTQKFLVEKIELLPSRFYYSPVPWSPRSLSLPPYKKNGYITYGSFNNTRKLNDEVISAWSEILLKVSNARLRLKWETFEDTLYVEKIKNEFRYRGVNPDRIETEGRSYHKDLLLKYSEIDIALDPFPFNGGYTNLEALWMGLALVTLPQDRIAGRQGYSLCSQIGRLEGIAHSYSDYVNKAINLAANSDRLIEIKASSRQLMRQSPLMNLPLFMESYQSRLLAIYDTCLKL